MKTICKIIPFLIFLASLTLYACGGGGGGSSSNNTDIPVLDSLIVTGTGSDFIEIQSPEFTNEGSPSPSVQAYIGLDGTITASGSTVSNYTQGPVNVSSSGCRFSGLSANTTYKIYVVASNTEGYSVKYIIQSTSGIAPALHPVSIGHIDSSSVEILTPTFTTAGNPTPAVTAYIGYNGTISITGQTVSNYLESSNVSAGCTFSALTANTEYRIIVVAANSSGYSVEQTLINTGPIAPVLNNLSIQVFDNSSITLEKPSFSTAGNPTPTVLAYIGRSDTISVSGKTVSGNIGGAVDVSGGSYQFTGLSANTSYEIIVIAENSEGYSSKIITQSTDTIAPVLNNLVISAFDSTSITIQMPTFSVTGNPAPAVNAYIGLSTSILVSGKNVSGSLSGPIDVSSGSHSFTGLPTNKTYKIIVVAENSKGYSVKEISQDTNITAPALNNISISASTDTSLTIDKPSFSTTGNPAPTVKAYIGLEGSIFVADAVVSGTIIEGNIDVSLGGYTFDGLTVNTSYRIIVIAQNSAGSSVKQIAVKTVHDPDSLGIPAIGQSGSVTLTTGNNSHGFKKLWHLDNSDASNNVNYIFQSSYIGYDVDQEEMYFYFGNDGLYILVKEMPADPWVLYSGDYTYNNADHTFTSTCYATNGGQIEISGSMAQLLVKNRNERWDLRKVNEVTSNVVLNVYHIDPLSYEEPYTDYIDNTLPVATPVINNLTASYSSNTLTINYDITAPAGKLINHIIIYSISPLLYSKYQISEEYYNDDVENLAGQAIQSWKAISEAANRITGTNIQTLPGLENGTWRLVKMYIQCTDGTRYELLNNVEGTLLENYYMCDWSTGKKYKDTGSNVTEFIVSGGSVDTTAPLLTGISINSGILTFTSNETLSFIRFECAINDTSTSYSLGSSYPGSGFTFSTYDLDLNVVISMPAGNYYITNVVLTDIAGNTSIYYGYDTDVSIWSGIFSGFGIDFSKMHRYLGPESMPEETTLNNFSFTKY